MPTLNFRTIQGKQFQLDFDETVKVADVKAKIEETQGADFPADKMNVIYQGKILKDDTTVGENNVTEAGFCVVMVIKAKKPAEAAAPAAEAPKPAEAAPPAAAASPSAAAPAPEAAAPAAEAAPAADAPAAEPADPYAAAASELATGTALQDKIAQICDMGFPKEEVERAMRAAFNNPERAVEYLMTGIPAGLEAAVAPPAAGGGAAPGVQQQQAAAPQQPVDQPFNMFAPAPPGGAAPGGGGGGGPLDFLRGSPQFQALRGIVQQNPQLLQPMLAELGRSNPALLEQINGHQAEFLELINEPVGEGANEAALAALAQQMGAEMGPEGEGGEPIEIELTQEEADAVERLAGLGFPRELCLEAFLICDKNENMAANYLFEHAGGM